MIRVTCEPRRVVLEGHAGYAPKGSDIVCAAVSMLVYVQFHLLEEQGLLERSVMRPGYVELSAREGGQVKVEGTVTALVYEENGPGRNFWGRLFG